MKMKFPVIHYVLIALLAMPTFVQAEEDSANHDWAVLQAFQPGEKLFVKLEQNRKVKGALRDVSENMLVLSDGDQIINLDRQNILEVRLGHGRSLKKPIMLGALIGAGAGAGLGGAVAASDNGEWFDVKASQGIPIVAAVGAIFGTVVGTVVGLFRGQGELIYKASM